MNQKEELNNNLKNSVMQKIGEQKPTSKKWYQISDWARFAAILLLSVLAGILLGFYLWDVSESLQLVPTFGLGFFVIINSFLELVIVTLAISLLLYFLYRQTDWFLVSQRWLVFLGIWGVILLVSVIFLFVSVRTSKIDNFLQDTRNQSNGLPFRQRRVDNILERQKENGFITGRVESITVINEDETELKINNPLEQLTLKTSPKLARNLKIGDFVRVKIDPSNSAKALEINRIRRPPPNFIPPSVIF